LGGEKILVSYFLGWKRVYSRNVLSFFLSFQFLFIFLSWVHCMLLSYAPIQNLLNQTKFRNQFSFQFTLNYTNLLVLSIIIKKVSKLSNLLCNQIKTSIIIDIFFLFQRLSGHIYPFELHLNLEVLRNTTRARFHPLN